MPRATSSTEGGKGSGVGLHDCRAGKMPEVVREMEY